MLFLYSLSRKVNDYSLNIEICGLKSLLPDLCCQEGGLQLVKLYLKDTYPEPKTHEFIVMAKYNQMIDSIVEEFVRSEITKIVSMFKGELFTRH